MDKKNNTELINSAAMGRKLIEIIRKWCGLLHGDFDHVMKNGGLVKLVITGKIEKNTSRRRQRRKSL